MRTPSLWPLTLAAMVLWACAALLALWQGFPASRPVQAVLQRAAAYGIGLTLLRGRRRLSFRPPAAWPRPLAFMLHRHEMVMGASKSRPV